MAAKLGKTGMLLLHYAKSIMQLEKNSPQRGIRPSEDWHKARVSMPARDPKVFRREGP